MPTESESELIHTGEWIYRLRRPSRTDSQQITLLLHGWTGTEDVMWVFARHSFRDSWVLSPRGLFSSSEGGYGWTSTRSGLQATLQEFLTAVQKVNDWLWQWIQNRGILHPQISLVGFSQGAALAYSYGLVHLHPVRAIAGLSGFVPMGSESYISMSPLHGVPVFIAHGTKDETVSVERAREGSTILEQAGAKVTYCESPVGHKLGVNCMHALEEFFDQLSEN